MNLHKVPRTVWFDLETTGLPPFVENKVKIVEIGLVIRENLTQKSGSPWSSFVDPECQVPEIITKLTGIAQKHVTGKPTFAQLAPEIFQSMDGAIWAGHNIDAFDVPLLQLEFQRCGLAPPKCVGTIDTLKIATRYLKGRQGLPNLRMETLARYFGVLPPHAEQHHRALSDVSMNIKMAQRMFMQLWLENHTYPEILRAQHADAPVVGADEALNGAVRALSVSSEEKQAPTAVAVTVTEAPPPVRRLPAFLRGPPLDPGRKRCQGIKRDGEQCKNFTGIDTDGRCYVHRVYSS